jgi:hypothetical protein
MAKQVGRFFSWLGEKLWPSPYVEFLVGETGVAPKVTPYGSLLFSMRAPLYVQQMLHEHDPGGVQIFALDVWVQIPTNHYGVISPHMSGWSGGRLVAIPKYLSPGWSGELVVTLFNSHPEEVAALPVGAPGFELILAPTTGRLCKVNKT